MRTTNGQWVNISTHCAMEILAMLDTDTTYVEYVKVVGTITFNCAIQYVNGAWEYKSW